MDSEQTLNSYFATYVPFVEQEMRRVIQGVYFEEAIPVLPVMRPLGFKTMLDYHLGFANTDGTSAQVYSGKRIRPILTLLSSEACGGQAQNSIAAAAAIELLHNFSLIHDDIEDRDELRRGRPTLWKLWGEAQAINSGDAMFTLAHVALQSSFRNGVDPARVLYALRTLDDACIALTVGQHLDLSFESRTDVTAAEYTEMIQGKTGALTKAACAIGALMAGAGEDQVNALACFGAWLGIAFQLQDDVLGIWGDIELTGKTDSDLSHRKKTLPVLYAAERDERIRALYYRREPHTDVDIEILRKYIEAAGGRTYTEKAARDAYIKSLAALDSVRLQGAAANALRELAHGLIGRVA
jgi:geranylgeranyl diphosphate synthase, type I